MRPTIGGAIAVYLGVGAGSRQMCFQHSLIDETRAARHNPGPCEQLAEAWLGWLKYLLSVGACGSPCT